LETSRSACCTAVLLQDSTASASTTSDATLRTYFQAFLSWNQA